MTSDKARLTKVLSGDAAAAIAGRDKEFGDLVFEILMATGHEGTLRYVVV